MLVSVLMKRMAAAVLLKIHSTPDNRVVSAHEGMPKIQSKVDRWIVSTLEDMLVSVLMKRMAAAVLLKIQRGSLGA
jgi:hypothetical protein